MKTTNHLTFITYKASLKLKPNDPIKIIFNDIDWSPQWQYCASSVVSQQRLYTGQFSPGFRRLSWSKQKA